LSQKFPNVLELAAAAMTGNRSLASLHRYYNPTSFEIAARLDASKSELWLPWFFSFKCLSQKLKNQYEEVAVIGQFFLG
jgi:hypothetical protein